MRVSPVPQLLLEVVHQLEEVHRKQISVNSLRLLQCTSVCTVQYVRYTFLLLRFVYVHYSQTVCLHCTCTLLPYTQHTGNCASPYFNGSTIHMYVYVYILVCMHHLYTFYSVCKCTHYPWPVGPRGLLHYTSICFNFLMGKHTSPN